MLMNSMLYGFGAEGFDELDPPDGDELDGDELDSLTELEDLDDPCELIISSEFSVAAGEPA